MVKLKKPIDIYRQSINSNLTTNIGETYVGETNDLNSQSSILLGTFDERKVRKDFSSCKHLEHTQSSRVTNIGKISSRSNRLNEFQLIVESSHCPRFRKMRQGSQHNGHSALALAGMSSLRIVDQSSLRAGESSLVTPTKDSIGNLTPFKKGSAPSQMVARIQEKQFLDLNEIVQEHPLDQEQTF